MEERELPELKDRIIAPEIAAEAVRAYAVETNPVEPLAAGSGDALWMLIEKIVLVLCSRRGEIDPTLRDDMGQVLPLTSGTLFERLAKRQNRR